METADLTTEANVMPINIPYPAVAERHLRIAVGACRLRIAPGEGETWVTGTYDGPTEALPLEISQAGGEVRIGQRQEWGVMTRLFDGPTVLELTISKALPFALTIETGASENYLDLGGLPLTRFTLNQGAGKVAIDFSAPNPAAMDKLKVSSGASGIEMSRLANANFAEMSVEGGAASYKLDFGGTLQRDAFVKVTAAMSSTEIDVPASTAAKVTSQAMMAGVSAGDGFTRKDDAFWTQAALASLQPTLSMQVQLTMGALTLYTK